MDESVKESEFTDLGAAVEVAVVLLGAVLEVKSPKMTPFAGMTGPFELGEFWYGAAPESWAAETMFQPLDFITGCALIKASTAWSESSCSRMMRPGFLGPEARGKMSVSRLER